MNKLDTNSKTKKIVIVGGVAAGMSAAARIRRLSEGSEIIVFEKGGHVSFANCGLPYYLGNEITSRNDLLLHTPQSLKQRFNIDARVYHEVVDINSKDKFVTFKNHKTMTVATESYDDLILAVGAAPIKPSIPGIDLPGVFTLRSIEDMDNIHSWIEDEKPSNAIVVGGGFIGLETAEQLVKRGINVTIVDNQDQVLKPIDIEMAGLVHQELISNGIQLILNSPIKKISVSEEQSKDKQKSKLLSVTVGTREALLSDLVILGMGIRPELDLARKANIAIGKSGGIIVNELSQTNVPHIWAIGDAIEVVHPISQQPTRIALAGPANKQGRIVANNIFGQHDKYDGTLGTAIIRVFDLTVATVGLNEAQIKSAALDYDAVHIHPTQHASYFPGAKRLAMKILFNRSNGQILGAQIIGNDGADKRIDILATAIKGKLAIQDLADLELAYAPPYGSAKDPINLAGMVAENILEGRTEQIQWHEISKADTKQYFILDVRNDQERSEGFISGSFHIPLPIIREQTSKIPLEKTIIVYCQSGQRSYIASRILVQLGYRVKNLSGGYLTWKTAVNAQAIRQPLKLVTTR